MGNRLLFPLLCIIFIMFSKYYDQIFVFVE
jgi:hypothetical protein